ncbi:MAG: tRNA glutamyl-Q(34) synthetase GluQRS [Gammaproteobacteria bacterium]
MAYVGRFAPTPSGPLHLGSLCTALASYLDARHHRGQWLVRIEDVDQPRCVKQADTLILRTLERFGLYWDAQPQYQSQQTALYTAILDQLAQQASHRHGGPLFACNCTRQQLSTRPSKANRAYPGYCSHRVIRSITASSQHRPPHYALRWQLPNKPIGFNDRRLGPQINYPAHDIGAPVLIRKDGLFAYHWAVVIDDWQQGITDVVRGHDLLEQTSVHLCLQRALHAPTPRYTHLPIVLGAQGKKLSKSERAASLDSASPTPILLKLLIALGQIDAADAVQQWGASPDEIIKYAIPRWSIGKIPKITSLSAQHLLA